jgi:predicted ATPase
MIKSLYIDNFKALNQFTIDFQPLTLLIGANSVGKSTVLQALELLAYFTKGKENGELNNYLIQQGWSAKDLKSTLSRKRHITFILKIEIEKVEYAWTVILNVKGDLFEVVKEEIKNESGFILLNREGDHGEYYSIQQPTGGFIIPMVTSAFILFNQKFNEDFPELAAIKKALNSLAMFDFSSTTSLKSPNKLSLKSNIGRNGENLAAYLYQLSKEDLAKLSDELRVYAPFFEKIKITKKSRGEVEIDIKEKFNNNHIDATHLSDGMMRLLAILTLALTESGHQTILIEEIEDGINPNLAGEVIKTLLKVTEDTNQQFILTTHNPLILDWVPVESIHFLYRKPDGQVQQKKFKDSPIVLQNLDYMNPGEIWINFKEEELIAE